VTPQSVGGNRAALPAEDAMEHVQAPLAGSVPGTTFASTADSAAARESFAELLAAHWEHAYRFAYYLTGNAPDLSLIHI